MKNRCAGHRDSLRGALFGRRPGALRAAAVLRLHGPRIRLVADDGHVRQRDQQADRRSVVRVRRRLDRRSIRSAAADDGRNRHGRRRAGRPRRDVGGWAFYFFYFFNALGYVCGGPLPNQVLLSRWFDKSRGKAMGIAYLGIGVGGALVPLLSAWLTEPVRVARLAAARRRADRACRVSDGVLRRRYARSARRRAARLRWRAGRRRLRQPGARDSHVAGAFYLLALGSMCSIAAVGGTNQHLKLFLSLDRGYGQTDAARIISLVLTVSIVGRLLMGWLADRMARQARDAADLHAGRRVGPAAARRRTRRHDVRVCGRVRPRTRRRVHDHSADGRASCSASNPRPRHGHRADGRRRRRSDGADAGRLPARSQRIGTRPDSSRSSRRRWRRACHRAAAAEDRAKLHANRRRQSHRLQSRPELRHAEARHRGRRLTAWATRRSTAASWRWRAT